MQPVTIKLFLTKGDPNSLTTAEISNWTGKAISSPRTELKELFKREDLKKPGVYILSGVNPESNNPLIYIGEADPVVDRIKGHSSKDYWVNVIIFVSKDDNLTKAHCKYLEGKLIRKAEEADQAEIVNSVASNASLSESDIAEMDVFLKNIFQLLPVLGIDYFMTSEEKTSTEKEVFYCNIKGLSAQGKRSPNGFVVFKNSKAVLEHRPSAKTIRTVRERLINSGILIREDNHLVFSRDFEFGSPSTAAGVVRGGNASGLLEWKNSKGKSLKELEREETLE